MYASSACAWNRRENTHSQAVNHKIDNALSIARLVIAEDEQHLIGQRRCLSVFKRFSASLPPSDVLRGNGFMFLGGDGRGSK